MNQDMIQSEKTCVILNSHQGKTPRGIDPWVLKTIDAVKYAIENDFTVITSVGLNTWELVLWACGEFQGRCIVIAPVIKKDKNVNNMEYFMQDFGLNLNNCGFVYLETAKNAGRGKSWWNIRDKTAIEMAYEIIPVCIKKSGHMSDLLKTRMDSGKTVNNSFRVDNGISPVKDPSLSIEIPQVGISYDWGYLVHWTRRFYKPWPGESSQDYFRKVVQSAESYSHSAGNTLSNLLNAMVIFGSSSRIKNKVPVVAFTEHPPCESVKLMKWRSRYVRYTFEPFGIAIRKDAAVKAGIKPVEYIRKKDITQTIADRNPDEFTQTWDKGEWYKEKEWRFKGNLNLRIFSPCDIKILVPSLEIVNRFTGKFPFDVLSLDSI